MNGYFSAHMLERYAELLAEQIPVEFSEETDTYDFTRCVRPDGSAYAIATGKKCRQGTEQAADVVAPKAKKAKKEKAPAAPNAPAAKKPGAKAAAAAAPAPKAEKPAAPAAPKGPQTKVQKLKELASKLKDDVLAKLTKNPKAPPELQKAAQAEIAKRAGKPEAAPKAVKKEAPAKPMAQKPAKPAAEKPAAKPAAKTPAKGKATPEEIATQKKKAEDLLKAAKNAKSSQEEEKLFNQWKKEKAKYEKMAGKNQGSGGAKPKAAETPDSVDKKIKKLEAQGEELKKAFQKHQEAGDWAKADAAIKKATAVNKKLDELKGVSTKLKKDMEERQKKAAEGDAVQKKLNERQLAANLTPAQKKAIANYTAEGAKFGYDKMNTCLRTPPSCEDPAEAKKVNKQFDAALKALPKNTDGDTFYRGIGVQNSGATAALYAALEKAQPGQRFKDPAYGSYSSDSRQAEGFQYGASGKSILFVSRNKDLTPINMFSEIPSEREAVLPRSTEQTIRSVRKEGNMLVVELD